MQANLKTLNRKIVTIASSKHTHCLLKLLIVTTLMMLCRHAFAGDDPLEGTDSSLTATMGANGIGRRFMYLIEGVVAISTYIKTKNLLMFSGVVAIAIFLNILFKVAGIAG